MPGTSAAEIVAEFLRWVDRLRGRRSMEAEGKMSGNTSHWPEKLAFPDVRKRVELRSPGLF